MTEKELGSAISRRTCVSGGVLWGSQSRRCLGAPLAAQDRLAVELAQYQHEADPVRKARDLAKLGDEQIALARKQLKDGKDVVCLQTLEQYRDEVRETVAKLEAAAPNAEKNPAGFKELQISVRETVRHIDDLILTLPVDKRPFFREVRTDLVKDAERTDRRALSAAAESRCPRRRIREVLHAFHNASRLLLLAGHRCLSGAGAFAPPLLRRKRNI